MYFGKEEGQKWHTHRSTVSALATAKLFNACQITQGGLALARREWKRAHHIPMTRAIRTGHAEREKFRHAGGKRRVATYRSVGYGGRYFHGKLSFPPHQRAAQVTSIRKPFDRRHRSPSLLFMGAIRNDRRIAGRRRGSNGRSRPGCDRHPEQHYDWPNANHNDGREWPLWILVAFSRHL